MQLFALLLPTQIVKIGVDGLEPDILCGGRHTLSARSVRSMIVEMEGDLNSDRNRELFGVMAEPGFAPRPMLWPDLRNVIFERPASLVVSSLSCNPGPVAEKRSIPKVAYPRINPELERIRHRPARCRATLWASSPTPQRMPDLRHVIQLSPTK